MGPYMRTGPPRVPKACPICKQRFEQPPHTGILPTRMDEIDRMAGWEQVRNHLREVHPDYVAWEEAWRGKLLLLIIVLVVSLGLLIALGALGFFRGINWGPALTFIPIVVVAVPLVLHEYRGIRRFRREWLERHPLESPPTVSLT